MNFKDKVALITGGNSGIGYATAKELIENGATVVITGRRKEAVEKAANELGATGLVADQSRVEDIKQLMTAVAERYGKIDIMLVNAGISKTAPIESTSEELFDEVMNVNFKGAFFTLSLSIPILNEKASVVLLSSSSAHISPRTASVYAASKSALNTLMKIAALELAGRQIRVNAVSPGPVATEIMRKGGVNGDRNLEQMILDSVPLHRFGTPQEVAKLVAYLAGEEAAFITGSEFLIDGGQSA
ncbi:SDR family oxidoreductase [Parapedobacter sp. ISTM3]|uniref:SDR family oxidoreductase n=1 Tax=Parapedobacter sp. ISTM3 TaxID=2800130 RepID=UPI001904E098|nr:SDR family oxidoreductase [Parapedobacter sp. ISTM3]MBK1442655.1 SDR family oxidoreductase [Parapedobacter sp. ISTM3]